MTEQIFALDIGTRSVTGVLLEKHPDSYTVLDYCMKEHEARTMLDGQIHHVVEVAAIMKDVKDTLEYANGPLTHVCVAAAGRSLKTITASASVELNEFTITDQDAIKHLELSAVHQAQQQLADEQSKGTDKHFYCVGYSVLEYKLDNEPIGSLIDQRGQSATVNIIATFLPRVVVESLFSALERSGLEMEDLTLEPIAAINVLIPQSMRRLNVALVDIGAGTSDIAITEQGSISAYGMVPIAGDEITEAISDEYLLDFSIAEKTKRMIVNEGEATVTDILGFDTRITSDMLIKQIQPSIEKLAETISGEILSLNGKAPKAVMLVGGGSMTPGITSMLAQKLQLPANRVAVRGLEAIQNLHVQPNSPSGPDLVTPIGIAISAKTNPVHYVSVNVNGQLIRMFEMKSLTVGDCLVQAGIDIRKCYGKPGIAKMITFNGAAMTLPGEFGGKPEVYLNNALTAVDSLIKNGDHITVETGMDGQPSAVTIYDLVDDIPVSIIYFNDDPYPVKPIYYVNNHIQPGTYLIQDKDTIVLTYPETIKAFLSHYTSESVINSKSEYIYINGKPCAIHTFGTKTWLNGKAADINASFSPNDTISISKGKMPVTKDVLSENGYSLWDTMTIKFDHKPVVLKRPRIVVYRDDQVIDFDTILRPDDHLSVKEKQTGNFIFQDVFRYVDINLNNKRGHFTLYQNERPASFTDSLADGDSLSIVWDLADL